MDGEVRAERGGGADLHLVGAEFHLRRARGLDVTRRDGQHGDREGTCTVLDCPGSSVTRVKPASRWFGTSTTLTGWWTYTGTMSVPARLPVFDTVNLAVTVPCRDTLPVADSPLTLNVV